MVSLPSRNVNTAPAVSDAPDGILGLKDGELVRVLTINSTYVTRAEFASAWSNPRISRPKAGFVVEAGNFSYRYVGGETPLPYLSGWMPHGEWHVRHFGVNGATPLYIPNETELFQHAIDTASAARVPLHAEDMVFGVTDLILPDGYHVLIGNSRQGSFTTWFNSLGNKPLMRLGYKHTMSGTNIILLGNSARNIDTKRTDKFGSFSAGIRGVNYTSPYHWSGINVVQNMDVYTPEGDLTTSANHNLATGYDTGVCIRGPHHSFRHCTFFGYWAKGLSFVIHSSDSENTTDSDYNRFESCTFTGLGLVGANVIEFGINGLTGTQAINCQYFSAGDHHSRSSGRYATGDCPIVFVDGILTNGGGIRGHYFHGSFRARANVVGLLGSCTQCTFQGVSEFPEIPGDVDTELSGGFGRIAGTTARDITFSAFAAGNGGNGGMSSMWAGNAAQANVIGGGHPSQSYGFQNYFEGKVIRILHSETNGNAIINFSNVTTSNITAGWNIQREYSNTNFTIRFDNTGRFILPDDQAGVARIAYTGGLQIGTSSGPILTPTADGLSLNRGFAIAGALTVTGNVTALSLYGQTGSAFNIYAATGQDASLRAGDGGSASVRIGSSTKILVSEGQVRISDGNLRLGGPTGPVLRDVGNGRVTYTLPVFNDDAAAAAGGLNVGESYNLPGGVPTYRQV